MRTCLLLVFIFFVSSAYSQHAVVAANKMNVLYIGVDNPISVAAENYSCNDLKVEISQGELIKSKDNPCSYIAKVMATNKATITIKNNKGKILTEREYRVKRIPDPVVRLASFNHHLVSSTNELILGDGLIAALENFDFDTEFKIFSYVVATCRDGQLYAVEVSGSLYNDEVKALLKSASYGDVVMFDEIRCGGSDGTLRKLGPLIKTVGYNKKITCEGRLFNVYGDYPADTTYEMKLSEYRQWQTTCDCEGIDEASGNIINGKKSGWWDYKKIKGSDTLIARREYYNVDTVKQILYKKGIKDKEQTYVLGELVGDYYEYHTNSKLKIKGLYAVDSFSTDTIIVIDPITMEEVTLVETILRSSKSGTWQYFNEQGILTSEEKYVKGQLVK